MCQCPSPSPSVAVCVWPHCVHCDLWTLQCVPEPRSGSPQSSPPLLYPTPPVSPPLVLLLHPPLFSPPVPLLSILPAPHCLTVQPSLWGYLSLRWWSQVLVGLA